MNKLCGIYKHLLLLGIVMLTAVGAFAQPEKFNRANLLLREKNADLAVPTIDSVVVHPETMNDAASWTLRAFIYFELYKRGEKYKLFSPIRDTIIRSIKRSYALKPDEDNAGNNKKLVINLSAGYFNLARTLLQDSIDDVRSQIAYNKYKELYMIVDTTANFTAKDIEYYLAVGSVYSDIFIKDNKNVKAQNIAKVALLKVLEIQDDNPAGNITLGLMYYNQAVNLTREMPYEVELSQLDFVQENIVKLAKQSEQFVYKVYSKDNKNLKAIEALYYIYRMLNEMAKSDEFKKIGEQYGIKFNIEEKTGDTNGQTAPENTPPGNGQAKEEKAPEKPKEEVKEEKPKSKEELEKEQKAAAEKARADEKAAKEADKKAKKDKKEQEEREAKEAKEKEKKAKEEAKAKDTNDQNQK